MRYYVDKGEKSFFPVQDGLTLTPSQMDTMRKQGRPVSTMQLPEDMFFDGATKPTGITIENARGIDVNDVWQAQQTAKKKIKKFSDGYKSKQNDPVSVPDPQK